VPDSKGGSGGSLFNGALINQVGEQGKAILFDGVNDYMTIPMPSIFNAGMSNDFSVLCRFKNPTITSSARVFEAAIATTDFVTVHLKDGIISGNVAKNNVRRAKRMDGTLSTSTFYTVVITWQQSTNTVKVYVNGAEVTTDYGGSSTGVNGASTVAYIAKWYGAPTYANVLWETLGIMNKVLTPAEIAWLNDKEYADL
jgi:hypothetical protein